MSKYSFIYKYYSVKFSDRMIIFSNVKGLQSSLRVFLTNESPLRMTKMIKSSFCSYVLVMKENNLIRTEVFQKKIVTS